MDDDELIAAAARGNDVALRELFRRRALCLAGRPAPARSRRDGQARAESNLGTAPCSRRPYLMCSVGPPNDCAGYPDAVLGGQILNPAW
jgi:hypothetical protein